MTNGARLEHILLTRFNVYYEDRGLPSDEWLRERLNLFQQYTLPSVRSQTVPPDKWLILSHEASPQWFKDEIARLLIDVPISSVIWMNEPWDETLVAAMVGEWVPSDAAQLLTTLLDNDDAVARDFIAIIRANCHGQAWEFLNLIKGAQFAGGKMYHRSDPANPFISLLETLSDGPPRTAFIDWHNRLGRHGPVRQIYAHPTWVQIVHGGNMQNAIHGLRARADTITAHFDVDFEIERIGRLANSADTVWTAAKLSLRVARSPHRIVWLLQVARSVVRSWFTPSSP
jgi:hypothetical protein